MRLNIWRLVPATTLVLGNLLALSGGCPTSSLHPRDLTTGIRVRAEFLPSPFLAPGTGSPVPGVRETGLFLRFDGGPTGGTDELFQGFTFDDGIDDHPNAITGAFWNFSADYSPSPLPACGSLSLPGQDVPFPAVIVQSSLL